MGLSASGHGGAGDATPLEDGVGTIPSCQKGRFRGSRSPGQPAPDHELHRWTRAWTAEVLL